MMTTGEIEKRRFDGFLPETEVERLEAKLESTNNKLNYLIKRLSEYTKTKSGSGSPELTPERLRRIAEKLRDRGLSIEYTDGRGIVKLKALDQRGLDNLKKLNTLFPFELIESYLENT